MVAISTICELQKWQTPILGVALNFLITGGQKGGTFLRAWDIFPKEINNLWKFLKISFKYYVQLNKWKEVLQEFAETLMISEKYSNQTSQMKFEWKNFK